MCKRRVNPGFQLKFGNGVIALNQKFRSIRGTIAQKWKLEDCFELRRNPYLKTKTAPFWVKTERERERTRRRVVWSLFIIFFIFPEKLVMSPPLQVHLMYLTSTKFAKPCTKLITKHPSMSGYGHHRQINGHGTTPKWPPQASCSWDLTVHHANFEPTVGILPNRIKGWKLFPCKNRITLFHPYK
jgi:hypothetical protein